MSFIPDAQLIADDDEFLEGLHGEQRSECYETGKGGKMEHSIGHLVAADFVRWVQIREQRIQTEGSPEQSISPIGHFDMGSALRMFEAWVLADFDSMTCQAAEK